MAVRIRALALTMILIVLAGPAQAYVGPGAGVSLIGAAVGLIFAIVLALGVIVLWPLRRLLKRRKTARQDVDGNDPAPASADPD